MITIDICRVKSFYANKKEERHYDIRIGNCNIMDLEREDMIELYHSIAAFFKEIEKEELI